MAGGAQGQLAKVVLFVAGFLLLFVYIGFSIPQSDSKPPAETVFDVSAIKTKQDLAKIGQSIFFGNGKCALCHSIGDNSGRCPNLEIKGGQLTREFLYESLTQPSKYIYMDYTASPPRAFPAHMPVINKPPIDLDPNELLSVISFIQSQGGEVTVEPSEIVVGDSAASLGRAGDPAAGQKTFARMNCAKCHSADLLRAKLANKDEGMIRLAILDANAGIKTDPKPVHKGFDQALSVRDFNDLTAYLAGLKTAAAAP